MTYVLRDYQEAAAQSTADFLMDGRRNKHGLIVVPTGAGKSLILAQAALRLDGPCLIFQPSKEILEQNLAKFQSYGYRPAVYSASMGRKTIGDLTLLTIGSVKNKGHLFEDFPYVLIDEADLCGAKKGMYKNFFDSLPAVRMAGYTATPYRLTSDGFGSILKFLTRTRPRIFSEIIYYVQNKELFDQGYLAKLEYHKVSGFDRHAVKSNSTGADFDERALQLHFFKIGFQEKIVKVVTRLIERGRKNALVFCRFVKEAEFVAEQIPGAALVAAETHKAERAAIIDEFRKGRIKVLVNVGVLTVGADFPELETVVLARPTKSLRLYYQMVGRAIRPHSDKETAWVVDMCGLTDEFGHIEDLMLYCEGDVKWSVYGKPGGQEEKQLTQVYLNDKGGNRCKQCGQAIGFWMRHEVTGNSAGLCRPPAGVQPNITLRKNLEGKTVYAIPRSGDPDFGQVEFIMHRVICGKQLNGGTNG